MAYAGIVTATGNDDRRSRVALLAAWPGIVIATDGDQANLLVAGTTLLAFAAFERGRSGVGAAAIAAGTLVKLFPLGGVLLALLHPDRERTLFRLILALTVGSLLPLAVLSPATLALEHVSWFALLRVDYANRGWSLVTVFRDLGVPVVTLQVSLGATLAVPLVGALTGATTPAFRRSAAAALLVTIVLGNHRSEYTSFVLSATGVGLWFAARPPTLGRVLLLALASVAHGPVHVVDDPVLGGPLSFLAAHRVFHPLRLAPLVLVWTSLQLDIVRFLAARPSRAQRDGSVR